MMAARRLRQELVSLSDDSPIGVSAAPIGDDLFAWHGLLCGPDNSPFEGGVFELELDFSSEYPFKAPLVKFTTKVFHPNVFETGGICLDILREKWSPSLDIRSLLISIQSLLVSPDLHTSHEGAANSEAEYIYRTDRARYNSIVRRLVRDQPLEGMATTVENTPDSSFVDDGN